ncbi:cation:proton antiporter [Nostoc sp. CHAB 5834]|nr:cation:proton antiporter [Nostoc sp. CHAB 5834]
MTLFQGAGILLTLVAIFGVINYKFIGLSDSIGITAVGLIASLVVALLSHGHPEIGAGAQRLVEQIDFTEIVFHGFLCLMLFASALHVDLGRMKKYKWPVFIPQRRKTSAFMPGI